MSHHFVVIYSYRKDKKGLKKMTNNVNVNEETTTNTDEIISVVNCLGSVVECFKDFGDYELLFDEKVWEKLYNCFEELNQKSMKDILDELKNTKTEFDEISNSICTLASYTNDDTVYRLNSEILDGLFFSFLSKFGWNYRMNEILEE